MADGTAEHDSTTSTPAKVSAAKTAKAVTAESPTAALASLLGAKPARRRRLTLQDVARGTPYRPEAFAFLQRGLARASADLHGEADEASGPRHVSGRDLCLGLRRQAHEEWGLLAGTVLARLGVRQTLDFGHIVFALVAHDILSVSDDDKVEDFDDVYDFASFDDDYVIA